MNSARMLRGIGVQLMRQLRYVTRHVPLNAFTHKNYFQQTRKSNYSNSICSLKPLSLKEMPRKRAARRYDDEEEEDDFVVVDPDEGPKNKRSKSTVTKTASGSIPLGGRQVDDDGNPFFEIGGRLRRVTVSKYKGNTLINIREHYEKDGRILPGKKGISLSVEQFNALLVALPQIESELQKDNISVLRPDYGRIKAGIKTTAENEEEPDEYDLQDENDDEQEEEQEKDDQEEAEEEESEEEEKPPRKRQYATARKNASNSR